MPENQNNIYKSLWQQLRNLFNMEVDSAKLFITEKLTLLVTSIAFYAALFVMGTCVLVFLSIGVADILMHDLPYYWAYIIIAGFYLLIILILIAFRRQLITDPIARFLSRVILDPPQTHDNKQQ